jgi:hypothetical protein
MEAMLKGEREASPCQECSVALVVKLPVFVEMPRGLSARDQRGVLFGLTLLVLALSGVRRLVRGPVNGAT